MGIQRFTFQWVLIGLFLAPLSVFAEVVIRVPEDSATITSAVAVVPDGGTIDVAGGTYVAPAPNGFTFSNLGKAFTIRAREGATVVLDGQGVRPVFRLINGSAGAAAQTVVLQGLEFRNGLSTTDGRGGGVTLSRARATFIDCLFEDNVSDAPSTGGGGVAVFTDSYAVFNDCIWRDNSATNEGAGLRVGGNSLLGFEAEAYIHDSQFINNRVNLAGHRPSSAGGGIHIGDGKVRISNTRFEGNQAGFVGGAIFAIGSWIDPVTTPQSEVILADCTFLNNKSEVFPGVFLATPTSGGAIHVEDQTLLEIHHSRFITNTGDVGGALSGFRAVLSAHNSVFLGNTATEVGANTGFGGAIAFTSADTTADASTNRRNTEVTITDSYFQGRYGGVTTTGQVAGCLHVNGDLNRNYGLGGVIQLGTDADNRAPVTINNVVFSDCDVIKSAFGGTGIAGAINLALVDLDMQNSLVIDSDALGSVGFGGGLRIATESTGSVVGTTFAGNSAESFGGGILVQGSDIDITDCQFFENEISPGTAEGVLDSFGAAISSGVTENFAGQDFNATGVISNSVFSNNIGLPIHEDDRFDGLGKPQNFITYANNEFHNTTFGTSVFRNGLNGSGQSVADLNALSLHGMAKSPSMNNTALGSAPAVGALLGVPTQILGQVAAGDPESATKSYLGHAWSGTASAMLNGVTTFDQTGTQEAGVDTHSLDVGAENFQASITMGPTPVATLTPTPFILSGGESSSLAWAKTAGTFLRSYLNQEIDTANAASGSVMVTPVATTTYGLCMMTEEGGAWVEETIYVDEVPRIEFFSDGFESGSTSNWSASVP